MRGVRPAARLFVARLFVMCLVVAGLVVVCLVLAGCGGAPPPGPEPPPERAEPDERTEAAPRPTPEAVRARFRAPETPPEGLTCVRAYKCCRAYVQQMGGRTPGFDVDNVCGPIRELSTSVSTADEACRAAIGGWRQGLEAIDHPVPASCREPPTLE